MDAKNSTFLESLKSGFISKHISSNKEFHPRILLNNPSIDQRVLTTINHELNRCEEFWFSVAFVTTSGVASILNSLKLLEEKGVRGRILASQYQHFTQPEALRRLYKLANVELRLSVDRQLHTKGYLFKYEDSYNLIIGSSNLTANALSQNVEWNLKVSAKSESQLMQEALSEFESEFRLGFEVTDELLSRYELAYLATNALSSRPNLNLPEFFGTTEQRGKYLLGRETHELHARPSVEPNKMQADALQNLKSIRRTGKTKALLVSATGTGKTFLSAFDVKALGAKKLLFIVHRQNIAKAALASFEQVFESGRTYGLYSGQHREKDADFVFSTVQTISRPEHLHSFSPNHFDYIVIDESHRAGAGTYQTILNYFKPQFLLGMTATPERTDGFNIFELFDYTIAYEIRLHQALAENMLSPFHYYGITDIKVEGKLIEKDADFNQLTADERVERIIETIGFYGTDSGTVRGLVFCSRVDECEELALAFTRKGIQSLALTGASTEEERSSAIARLESSDHLQRLQYIFTVDIFNEGVDIPQINQVIMLRPTQSAIVFVQQMGRGLRKTDGKEYLTIIDFIGNYNNNFLVPIALYGDNSYNKDTLRRLMKFGSGPIPGTSTINFDKIAKERIFAAINAANMRRSRDLTQDYQLLKFQLGRPPMMEDFIAHQSRDPFLYVEYMKSFFNFAETQEATLRNALPERHRQVLELFSREINNAKRVEEPIILLKLINEDHVERKAIADEIFGRFNYRNENAIESAIHNLNFQFVRAKQNNQMISQSEIFNFRAVAETNNILRKSADLEELLQNRYFKEYLLDCTNYAISAYGRAFSNAKFKDGFLLYQKYSRKDVFRILGWKVNPVAQNVGGYIISERKDNCPIFVTYQKSENISASINYEDYLISNSVFAWMSKSNRTLESPDVLAIKEHDKHRMRIPLFIKKTDDEGQEFYFLGDVTPIAESFEQSTIENDDGRMLPVVKLKFELKSPVENSMYEYLAED